MRIPQSIGLIIDGNRRWARERGLPTFEGHRRGLHDALMSVVLHAATQGIAHMAVYAFSTENWHRSEKEVQYLMDLFRELVRKHVTKLYEHNIRIRVVGVTSLLPKDLRQMIGDIERESAKSAGMTLWIALSYGGRAEIRAAAAEMVQNGVVPETEEEFAAHLWTAELPDLDMVIRTGGERRLSNFLLWKVAYAELFFIEKYWPEFTPEDFDILLKEYGERERRKGR